jgi:hypothetical protein
MTPKAMRRRIIQTHNHRMRAPSLKKREKRREDG